MTHKSTDNGFTLIEMAFVILISSIVLLTVLRLVSLYNFENPKSITRQSLEKTSVALQTFLAQNGRYPCPADPTLGPGDLGYGIEICDPALYQTLVGYQDSDNDGVIEPVLDSALWGSIPVTTLIAQSPPLNDFLGNPVLGVQDNVSFKYRAKDSIDGWGNKISYAVTLSMADPAMIYDETQGRLEVADESSVTVLQQAASAHFVLVSHGANGIGGYSKSGTEIAPCGNAAIVIDTTNPQTPPAIPGGSTFVDESENCDGVEGRFLLGPFTENANDPNDDLIRFYLTQSSTLWRPLGGGAGVQTVLINNNPGSVGIGTNTPLQQLHIVGDMQAEQAFGESYCDNNEAGACLRPEVIASDVGMVCPPGQVANAIVNNNVVCIPHTFPFPDLSSPPPAPFVSQCPAGERMIGINSVTGVLCTTYNP